ncbi:pyrroloquinoline quinone biosynthesis protein PqqF [Stutzerimonas stutzeri]
MTRPDPRLHRPSLDRLPNGLRVRMVPSVAGTQAAALVRIHAGSHDAPVAYPGLAHFLEHMLFLGSAQYTAEAALMPFVQGVGGQLNATTRERHTDFFFQVPARHLEQALLRLLDMLTQPRLDLDAQRREREVLHAEFLARAQDRETLCDAALATAITPMHPASSFHAGHRETLPVDDPAFQQALRGYLDHAYRTGNIELLLTGPQDSSELQRLAQMADTRLRPGAPMPQSAPALHACTDRWLTLHLPQARPRLLLGFVLDGCPQSASVDDYLASWIASEAPGGLLARLRDADLCQGLAMRVPYRFGDQGVLVIEAVLGEAGRRQRAAVAGAVLDWLRFFVAPACWPVCSGDYQEATRRRLLGAEPLQRLRHWVEPGAWSCEAGPEPEAVTALVRCMLASDPVMLTLTGEDGASGEPVDTQGFPLRMTYQTPEPMAMPDWCWQVPQPNPWLRSTSDMIERGQPAETLPLRALGPQDEGGQGALMLRWRFTNPPAVRHWHAVDLALRSRVWAARQAGVELAFEHLGCSWTLSLRGFAEIMPDILADLSPLLVRPPARYVAEGACRAEQAATLGQDAMLLRQLLDRLPQAVADPGESLSTCLAAAEMANLEDRWHDAVWEGLAVGFPEARMATLQSALRSLPGRPISGAMASVAPGRTNRWLHIPGPSGGEVAYVLFRPLPGLDAPSEAAWRVLARLLEGAFFRRLRSELQLGYAVLCRFGQFAGQAGVFFAVQSPTASAGEIHRHVEAFIEAFSLRLHDWPARDLASVTRETAEQQGEALAEWRGRSERAWQVVLAGQAPEHIEAVRAAMGELRPANLIQASRSLNGAGRLVLSNAPMPTSEWP